MPASFISHSLPTCKLDVELVLWLENLDVQRAVWSEVFDSPGSEDGLMILPTLKTEWIKLAIMGREWEEGEEVRCKEIISDIRLKHCYSFPLKLLDGVKQCDLPWSGLMQFGGCKIYLSCFKHLFGKMCCFKWCLLFFHEDITLKIFVHNAPKPDVWSRNRPIIFFVKSVYLCRWLQKVCRQSQYWVTY